MLLALSWSAIESAVYSGLSQLIVVSIVGFVVNIVYRRFRERSTAREDLLNEIDQFSVQLYKPRKIYQVMMDRGPSFLAGISNPEQRECRRLQIAHEVLVEWIAAAGRFRTLQVEIIRLYGYDYDLLGHYLAIWRFLKEMRRRMEQCEPLYLPGEKPGQDDAFYKLFDSFRFRVSVAKFVFRPPSAARPPADVLAQMRQKGDALFVEYFGSSAE
jgi:hypothetical protein